MKQDQDSHAATTPESTGTPNRRQLLGALALGAGAIGFNRLARAQGDASARVTQTASFGIGEGKEEEAAAAIAELVAAVEANEPGVLVYSAYRTGGTPGRVFFFEIYENEDVLKAHGQQPHLAKMGLSFQQGVFTGPPEIVRLESIAGYSRLSAE